MQRTPDLLSFRVEEVRGLGGGHFRAADFEPFYQKLMSLQENPELASLPGWLLAWADEVLAFP